MGDLPAGGETDLDSLSPDSLLSCSLEDMDIFYCRQLAFGLQDSAIQQKLEYEIKMRDGATKLLTAAASAKYTMGQCLEAAKTLLVSNARMAAYVDALQREKEAGRRAGTAQGYTGMSGLIDGNQLPSKATVAVSEIRIPLMWKDTDHFKNKGTHRRFAAFCVSQIGASIQETSIILPVDRTLTDVTFDDCLVMENASHDFRCKLSVYVHELCDDMTIASTPLKIRKKINSISSSIGRRLSSTGMKENVEDNAVSGPRFDVVAHAELSLKDCKDNAGIHDLVVNMDSDIGSGFPLFGNFCCRVVAQPYSLTKEAIATYLFVKDCHDHWQEYWCVLQNLRVSCWFTPFEADLEAAQLTIPVTKDSLIVDADPSNAERQYMFHIKSLSRSTDYTLAADSAETLKRWWEAFERHLLDQVVWDHACESLMEIRTAAPQQRPYVPTPHTAGSLYDKLSVKGTGAGCKMSAINHDASPLTIAFNRLTREENSPRSPALARKTSKH